MNYLKLDDVVITQEGKLVDPDSIMILPTNNGLPVFPASIFRIHRPDE